ncbi:MAG TPA: glycosyltransferase [Verrucomicrobiae bacterium]|nr:glycosyltransferase [Verrucomicrobiae bacterium]
MIETLPAPAPATSPRTPSRPASTVEAGAPAQRVLTDGKFFRVGAEKFCPKGVTYGPFKPDANGGTFPEPEQVERDFELITELNANCVRVYHVPPRWFLDMAPEYGLKVLVDYYWPKHTCFLDDKDSIGFAKRATRQAAEALKDHPAVFALTLANEIPPDIARWYGARRIEAFIDELAGIVKSVDPQRLVTFVSFPPTEFLQPKSIDFVSFNVYLHEPRPFSNYLDRLQSVAGGKPLVLAEFGMDSMREGEDRKAQILSGHIEIAFRAGLAGAFIFAFTDDWHTGGHQIENWYFGLTDRERNLRRSYHAVAEQFKRAPHFTLPDSPKVSVVVASYNGGRTLPACLNSLTHLKYPNYEIVLVDDGSTDDTARIAAQFPTVRTIHQRNMGLSAARNAGVAAAKGDIIAFTDSDCRADEDWLYYLVGDLLKTDAVAIGGHNFPPPEDNWVAGAVAAAPGGPAHVMLDDHNAEHIPGCNMAFWKWALEEIDGFDPIYRAAGDDVDVCWRLLQRDRRIAFSHSGFVWHYRRNTITAYLKQQRGYGVAEALLRYKHPEYFNSLGGLRWRGRIYNPSRMAGFFGRFVIYHGVFGSGLFQTLYTPEPGGLVSLLTSLEWHVMATLSGLVLAMMWPALWPLPVLTFLASLAVAAVATSRVTLPPWQRRFWSRPIVAAMYLLQPIVRGWPRYAHRLRRTETPTAARAAVRQLAKQYEGVGSTHAVHYWNEEGIERIAFLQKLIALLERDQWQASADSGWDEHDVTIHGDRFTKVVVNTVSENHGGNKRLLCARLSARWTLLGKVFLWSVVGLVALFLVMTNHAQWALSAWLLVAAVATYLHLRAHRTLRLGLGLLDVTAEEIGLIKLDAPRKFEKPD